VPIPQAAYPWPSLSSAANSDSAVREAISYTQPANTTPTIQLSSQPAGFLHTTQLDSGNYITTNHIMRIPEVVKQVLKTVLGPKPKPEARISVNDPESGCEVPGTSVRQAQGPEPGKLGIIFYYISLTLCMVGVCILLRCGFIEESERIPLLVFGLLLVVAGLLSLSIANYIYNREQRMLVTYLQDKVDIMKKQFHNNRVPTLSEKESLHT